MNMSQPEHKEFSHNGGDQIYHQKTPNSFKFSLLVVTEHFDTPDPEITRLLGVVCDRLNEPDLPDPDAERVAVLVSDIREIPLTSKAGDYRTCGLPVPDNMLLTMADCTDIATKLLRYDHIAQGIHSLSWYESQRMVVRYWVSLTLRDKSRNPLGRELHTFVWKAGDTL